MELNKTTFTNIILDNLNNSISDNGKVDLDHFINLTNKTYEAINYSLCCKSDSEQLLAYTEFLRKELHLNISDTWVESYKQNSK